ncbi:unnamed protein product [Parnassius mnemosyne]|uniref:Uncharacterized protein n=1 Tax=Parnassius mnemosyne TaxID=213953 RepID=A0AAV1KN49_9NEOP
MDSIEKWKKRYMSSDTAAVTKMFLPDIEAAYRLLQKLELSPILVQVLTGHGGFSSYLYRFKCKNSPECVCDSQKEESVEHLLLEYPKYLQDRFKLEMVTNMQPKKENISKLLACKKHRNRFITYCIDIAKDVINRNKTK